ncbi:DUF2058 domain-containing protein [Thiomicrospira sp. ALE5]|uniref:DUF2058 domain-containing protein n=1 Tax=Thiomicrospira sp. ALE5 TaxID=748650 RepID=UPI0008DEF9DA|nr:DUF2058 domain-containing protein [Thiomicrospira sp. ALE5]SFR51498.1 hypothetical protein SAMN03092900_0523 [Thiomicrospira sp. ALE5]
MASLLDQMKKAGLVNEHKAKQAKKEKYQQTKKQRQQGGKSVTTTADLAAEAAAQKAEKDRQLNLVRQQQQAEKAKQAELKQILSVHGLKHYSGEQTFNFVDGIQVKTLAVNDKTHAGLVAGAIRIVRWEGSYVLVASELTDKINQRDDQVLIPLATDATANDGLSDEDRDYYAKFAIPDDLVW